MTKKMTKVEALETAVLLLEDCDEAVEVCNILEKMATQLSASNKKRSSNRNKKANEAYEKAKNILLPVLSEKSITIDDIKQMEEFEGYSTQKISAILTKMRKEVGMDVIFTKVDGKERKSYKLKVKK